MDPSPNCACSPHYCKTFKVPGVRVNAFCLLFKSNFGVKFSFLLTTKSVLTEIVIDFIF